jgi:large subunit ribosomal protein L9
MEVILLEEVLGIGDRGDRVKVSPGYARNYLIPNKLAINAAVSGARVFEETERQRSRKEAQLVGQAEKAAGKITGTTVRIPVEVGEEDKLFGSVTTSDIAEALAAQGVEVDRRKIQLRDPLKSLGLHEVGVKVHRGVVATVTVVVERKNQPEVAAPAAAEEPVAEATEPEAAPEAETTGEPTES